MMAEKRNKKAILKDGLDYKIWNIIIKCKLL